LNGEFHRAARDNAESIVGGLAAFFSGFPLVYTTVGTVFIFVARHQASGEPKPAEGTPPEFFGWLLAVIGSFLFLLGIAIAICILIADRSLAKHTHYWFALAMACIECLFIPSVGFERQKRKARPNGGNQ
jgi:uncharacterized membrane protein